MLQINGQRLINSIEALGRVGIDGSGRRTRTAVSDADKAGRDLVCAWMKDAGMRVEVDRVGNIFGIWGEEPENSGLSVSDVPAASGEPTCNAAPLMTGSHIDTVINAGKYDGCLGVLAGIEVVRTMRENGIKPARPIVVAAFTNEEGVRYAPDMLGSLVFAGGMDVDEALAIRGVDGTILGDELARIGYAGAAHANCDADSAQAQEGAAHTKCDGQTSTPCAFIELHIEQGPILDKEGIQIGAVEDLQGISWYEITIEGRQNHAGTTPTDMRIDAGLAAAKVNVYLRGRCEIEGSRTVATVGTIVFEPNAVNVIPDKAVFTADIRNPNEERLQEEECALEEYLRGLEKSDGVKITARRMSRFEPVLFDRGIVERIEAAAAARGLSCRRMTSGAGQDAQNLAVICPTAMIFVPSVDGISHNPDEYTRDEDVVNGANVLLDVMMGLAVE